MVTNYCSNVIHITYRFTCSASCVCYDLWTVWARRDKRPDLTRHMDEECRDEEAIKALLTSLHYVGLTIYNADIRVQ